MCQLPEEIKWKLQICQMNYAIKKTECDANKILAENDLKYAHFRQIEGQRQLWWNQVTENYGQ